MKTQTKNTPSTFRTHLALMVVLSVVWLSRPAAGQTVDGKWAAHWRVLDNGEDDRLFLDLHQSGARVTGTATTIGHRYQVDGTVAGSHIDLSFSKGGNGRKLTGDIVGRKLQVKYQGAAMVAEPAGPGDEYPPYDKLPLPLLKGVTYNGLAPTPPMGWNSWNKFEDRVNDAIVREMADAMVTSGMRDAGYVYLNIDDTWEGVRDEKGNLGSNKKFPDLKALVELRPRTRVEVRHLLLSGAAHLRRVPG